MFKNYLIETNLLHNENINFETKLKDFEIKDNNNINMFITNSYSYIVLILQKYSKKLYSIYYLKYFILFYLYYFLYIANNTNKTNHKVYYNLNLIKLDF